MSPNSRANTTEGAGTRYAGTSAARVHASHATAASVSATAGGNK